jgi:diguanylate cyclase
MTRNAAALAAAFLLGLAIAQIAPQWWPTGGHRVEIIGSAPPAVWTAVFDGLAALASYLSPRNLAVIGASVMLITAVASAISLSSDHGAARARPTVATPAAAPQSLDASTTAELGVEITSLLKLLRGYLEANNRFATTLDRAQESLGRSSTPDQVWKIVKILMEENDAVRGDVRKLETQLESSREYIEQLRTSLAKAEEAALLDPLTGIGNRRRFDVDLGQSVEHAHADGTPLCLVLTDLDNFKRINDRFGHPLGDEMLKLFANLLAHNVKGRDRIACLGGEEFAILLPNTSMGNAYHLTEQIRNQLQNLDWVQERTGETAGKVTASFGIAQLGDGDSAQALFRRADAKLYEAKRNGRNQIAIEHSIAA